MWKRTWYFVHLTTDSMVNINDPEQVDKERHHTVATVLDTLKQPVQENERADNPKHQQRLEGCYKHTTKIRCLSYQIHQYARTILRNVEWVPWTNQYGHP